MTQASGDPVPFAPRFAPGAAEDLRRRLAATRLPRREVVDDWRQGVPVGAVRLLLDHWSTDYDLDRVPRRLGAVENVRVPVDGVGVHALHVRSPHPGARALVLVHGWPGSVLEFLDVLGPLSDPTAHGGLPRDAFHLVVPSLPGFGFSDAPTTTGWDTDRMADAVVAVARALGYERFGTQGGDWGSTIALKAGQRHPDHVLGVHVNFGYADPRAVERLGEPTAEERALRERTAGPSGHVVQQSTAPQTIGYALSDSPVGQLAWIVDKLHAWTDPSSRFDADRTLDFVTLYWMTNTAASSARLYWEGPLGWVDTVDAVPVGYTRFPHDTRGMSERMARTRFPRLTWFDVAAAGGHFAAAEQPAIFVDQVRAAFRTFGD